MRLGLDCFNISSGGGLTHLTELLKAANPESFGFKEVVLISCKKTLENIEDRPWLRKVHYKELEKGIFKRILWHCFSSKKEFRKFGCDIVFAPGGTALSGFQPIVTMCRNMLPFESKEIFRYGFSLKVLKLFILRFAQVRSFKSAQGIIFLSHYAKNRMNEFLEIPKDSPMIPHGVSQQFFKNTKKINLGAKGKEQNVSILYVSHISPYKHQCNVAEAIKILKSKGFNVNLKFVGGKAESFSLLQKTLCKIDPLKNYIRYIGELDHQELQSEMHNADLGVFASSCENLPNILLEMMASALPIASSKFGPMPEILNDAGTYFNPLDPKDISSAIEKLILDDQLSSIMSKKAQKFASAYNWTLCAKQTFGYLSMVARKQNENAKEKASKSILPLP